MTQSDTELQRFSAIIAERLGLVFDESRRDELVNALKVRVASKRMANVEAYLEHCQQSPEELRSLAATLTVGETYFYRNINHFRAFSETLANRWALARQPLRVLSAGSASGEEAYTVAMIVREQAPELIGLCTIDAIDVNVDALAKGKAGRYSPWSLRTTPEATMQRWFTRAGTDFVLQREIRDMVRFSERNITVGDSQFFGAQSFDVIFCRNVLIYFSPEAIRLAIDNFAQALAPEGLLFLGDAETLRGIDHDFELRHSHDTFYYQRKLSESVEVPTPPVPARPPQLVKQAPRSRSPKPRSNAVVPEASWDVARVMALLAAERFDETLQLLQALPSAAAKEPEAMLVRAVVLTNLGRLDEARAACGELLRADEFNVGAHYLMALCAEQSGDVASAERYDATAIYLDPSFAMPHLHLGRLLKRRGDLAGARRAIERATSFLAREDASRIMLYGGGFGRDALLGVCRAEHASLGSGG